MNKKIIRYQANQQQVFSDRLHPVLQKIFIHRGLAKRPWHINALAEQVQIVGTIYRLHGHEKVGIHASMSQMIRQILVFHLRTGYLFRRKRVTKFSHLFFGHIIDLVLGWRGWRGQYRKLTTFTGLVFGQNQYLWLDWRQSKGSQFFHRSGWRFGLSRRA